MKQLIEMYVSILVIMCIVCISSQMVFTHTQLQQAREYSQFVTEKMENSNLSPVAKQKLEDITNNNGYYKLKIEESDTSGDKTSYHIRLKYPVVEPFFAPFNSNKISYGVINTYASVGNNEVENASGSALGEAETTKTVGDITIKTYRSGTVAVLSGSGEFVNTYKGDESNIFLEELDGENIEKIIVNKGITKLDTFTFAKLDNLTSITLPSTLETIGNRCFEGLYITSIHIPGNVTSLNGNMFKNCEELSVIYVNNKKENVETEDFDDLEDTEIVFLQD